MKKFFKKTMSLVLVGAMAMTLLVGCGGGNSDSETKKGGAAVKDAAITMDQGSVTMGEARLFAYVMRSQYESLYGPQIWNMEIEDGKTFGEAMKEMTTTQLVQMILLSSKADEYKVSLTDEDHKSIDEYIANFKSSVGEEEMNKEGITEDDIRSVVEKSTLSGYVYEAMLKEESSELTDEEKEAAKCIKVQHVLISTIDTVKDDGEGNKVDMTEEEKEAYVEGQKAVAEEALKRAKAGEDFKALADEYSAENAGFEFSFDKNGFDPVTQSSMVEPFYTAAWKLAEGEISDLVESDYGYHIIKCVSANDEEATKASIENAQMQKNMSKLEEKLSKMMEEAKYTESDAWKAYKIVGEEPEVETGETGDETKASDDTDAETKDSESADTETETESK